MKKLLLVLCVALSAVATAHAQNLLKNPSFEDAGASGDTAASWNRWGNWINRETAWTPTHAGQCLIGYHHWRIEDAQNSGLWQDVANVKPGQKFRFSVFVSADATKPGDNSAEKVELRLETVRNGKEMMIESVTTPIADLQKTLGWHELSVSGTTPESNIRALIIVTPAASAPRGGAVKIDDAKLEPAK